MRNSIYLADPAFIVMVVAATEAYKYECYGFLLGFRRRGRIYVKVAFAYQTARRSPSSVTLVRRRRITVRNVLKAFPRYEYLGEFHSHPDYGCALGTVHLSDEDFNGVRPGEIELVMSVNRARALIPWRQCRDGSLSGVAGRHFVKMRAYLAVRKRADGIGSRVSNLRCSYAVTTANSRRLLEKNKKSPGP